ncbi:TPA: hypothetical protein ACH3X3_000343 [Trebouxia sp. C0006]
MTGLVWMPAEKCSEAVRLSSQIAAGIMGCKEEASLHLPVEFFSSSHPFACRLLSSNHHTPTDLVPLLWRRQLWRQKHARAKYRMSADFPVRSHPSGANVAGAGTFRVPCSLDSHQHNSSQSDSQLCYEHQNQ